VIGDDDEVLDYAEATLLVNIQCFVYETAYARADDGVCFIPMFNNWGWTNPFTEDALPVYAGAAHCDIDNGMYVGTYTFGDGFVLEDGLMLSEEHIYAGPTMFPQVQQGRRTVDTVAPGQYYLLEDYDWLIAHAVVGLPDPDFGPEE
jgi:hypothetical protein